MLAVVPCIWALLVVLRYSRYSLVAVGVVAACGGVGGACGAVCGAVRRVLCCGVCGGSGGRCVCLSVVRSLCCVCSGGRGVWWCGVGALIYRGIVIAGGAMPPAAVCMLLLLFPLSSEYAG